MPNSQVTEFDNVVVKARVDSRSTRSTFVVDDSTNATNQTITREEYDRISAEQDAYIAGQHVVVVDGYIGSDPAFRTRARLIMEAANANVAGMQKQLYYPVEGDYDPAHWEPDTTVIYTPNLAAPGYPDDRVIAVDLNSNITRVLNSDYFGESKKGGLRMWNNIVYNRGGLALHAGCKVMPRDGDPTSILIVGLSGTGKTTTTFTTQLDSKPAQDDFVALMPGGKVYTTENGCFAKTFGLDPSYEPPSTTRPPSRTPTWRTSRSTRRQGRLLRHLLHQERPHHLAVLLRAPVAGQRGPARGVPADPEQEREHRARRRPAGPGAGGRLLHARRDHRHLGRRQGRGGQVPARPGHEPVLPQEHGRHGQPDARAARQPRAEGLRAEHRPGRRHRTTRRPRR